MHAEDQRAFSGIALREQRAEHPRENVAYPGARHAGVPRAVDEPVTVTRDQDAAIALEDDVRVELARELLRRGDAIGLDLRDRTVHESGRLAGVRRDDGFGAAARTGLAQ